jgi:hypothetical protein
MDVCSSSRGPPFLDRQHSHDVVRSYEPPVAERHHSDVGSPHKVFFAHVHIVANVRSLSGPPITADNALWVQPCALIARYRRPNIRRLMSSERSNSIHAVAPGHQRKGRYSRRDRRQQAGGIGSPRRARVQSQMSGRASGLMATEASLGSAGGSQRGALLDTTRDLSPGSAGAGVVYAVRTDVAEAMGRGLRGCMW